MRGTFAALDRWQQDGETIAVATLVRACGSVPRLPGARLGLTRSGKMVGSVSGGCVENDVFEHALQVLDTGQPVIVRYGAADQLGLAVGLSCGGSIEVLIEPFAAAEAWQALCRAVQEERPAALGIGLTPPALVGRKLVVFDDGTCAGSVAADLDDRITVALQRLMLEGGTRMLSVPWRADTVTVFLEAFPAPQRLCIVGGTHTAIPLCRLAKVLGFRVTVIDARSAYATAERFPDADELLLARPDEALAGAGTDSTYVVILTHDPKFDLPALTSALRSGVRYIGILGSRKTHERRKAELRQQGFTGADLARIRAPIGLDLGARTPEEIALAILAEMLAVRYGRDGRALTDGKAAILGTR
jgi:xanthine dehydrogenase accessory factor